MAPRILFPPRAKRSGRRKAVVAGDGSYFAGEVVRILGLHRLDYDQLHRLFEIVRGGPRPAGTRHCWRRFTFADLAALRVAADLLGTENRKTQRLRLKQLAEVCAHLRAELGIQNPLIHAKLRAVGTTIVVQVNGSYFDATTRQRVFDEVARDVATYRNGRDDEVTRKARRQLGQKAATRRDVTGSYEAAVLDLAKAR